MEGHLGIRSGGAGNVGQVRDRGKMIVAGSTEGGVEEDIVLMRG